MRSSDEAIERAAELMLGFAERSGLGSARPPSRYLWTDAFAVCNFLALARATGQAHYRDLALELVEQVHRVLGRHRPDDARAGWISGLDEREGALHPTRGGLRIGKPLPERGPRDPLDERLEWERDGQYFHYLTQWMHALDQVSRALTEPRFELWARELAEAAHAAFCRGPRAGGRRRMVWKLSIDLSRALVPAMGMHDPLDGWIACVQLDPGQEQLGAALADYGAMLEGAEFGSDDPLGIGALLSGAARLAQLARAPGAAWGGIDADALLERIVDAALGGLDAYARSGETRAPAARRLAFRELGLAIGLAGLDLLRESARIRPAALEALASRAGLGGEITSFWLESRGTRAFLAHLDIDEVMLATSLLPDGYLNLQPAGRS